MRIFLLLAIAVSIVYVLDRQSRRWLQGIGKAMAEPMGRSTKSAGHQPASPVGRLVVCAGCGVRVAESLGERTASGSFYCSESCRPAADGR